MSSTTFNGSAIDVTTVDESATPVTIIDETISFVETVKLDETLRDYLRALVEKRTIRFEIRIDERHVMANLAAHWPHDASDIAQAERIWTCIDKVIQTIPTIKTSPAIHISVIGSSSTLVPQSIPSPHGYAVIATFNAENGHMHHCILPGLENLPPLDAMKVPAGLMVIAQPVAGIVNQFTDNRGSGLGAGNVYTDRTSDLHLPQHKVETSPEVKPSAAPVNTLG